MGAWVLQDFANSADEFAYHYQAKTFEQGQLSNPKRPRQEALSPFYILSHQDKVFSLFPPGWPLLLSFGTSANLIHWVNPWLAGLAITAAYGFARQLSDRKTAWLTVALMILSPFFLFNAASLFSHTACLFFCLTTAALLVRNQEAGHCGLALLAGLMGAYAFTIREMTAVLVLAPWVVYCWFYSRRRVFDLLLWLLGALPVLAAYFAYNQALTGAGWMPPRFLMESEQLGFGERTIRVFDYVRTQTHTPLDALIYTARNLGRLFLWTAPGLPLLALWFAWRKRFCRYLVPLGASMVLIIIGYCFYPTEGGNQYGPRFYFETFPFWALLAAMGCRELFPRLVQRKWIIAAILLAVLVQWGAWIRFYQEQIQERRTLFRLVEHRQLANALVFVGAPSGDMTQGDLIRNLPPLTEQPVIYAWHLGERNQAVMQRFPERNAYFFGWDEARRTYFLQPVVR